MHARTHASLLAHTHTHAIAVRRCQVETAAGRGRAGEGGGGVLSFFHKRYLLRRRSRRTRSIHTRNLLRGWKRKRRRGGSINVNTDAWSQRDKKTRTVASSVDMRLRKEERKHMSLALQRHEPRHTPYQWYHMPSLSQPHAPTCSLLQYQADHSGVREGT